MILIMRRYYLCLLSLGVLLSRGAAQTDVLMRTDTVRTCFAKFMDSGGLNGAYAANENHTIVLCPPAGQNPDSNRLSISFNSIDLGVGDMLCFFDGIGTNAPSLGCFSNFTGSLRQVIRATAPNTSGCITATFNSNATEQKTGWDANIICDYACQTFLAKIDYSSRPIVPVDTGWIDLCINEPLVLRAKGVYSQNDQPRHQSDSTTEFVWNFGDGRVTTVSQSVERSFPKPGGYILQLQLTDTATKCKNINFINQRIRVSPKPKFQLANIPAQVCANTPVRLNSVVNAQNNSYNVGVQAGSDSFPVGRQRSDSLALPDGNGREYRTTLRFNDFSPGQSLTNINDLLGICVNMEHSWARDLEISILCPNGQRSILHNFTTASGNEWYLGQPNDGDNSLTPIPGRGFDYCWTPTAPQTWRDYMTANPAAVAPRTIPAGNYAAAQPLTNLVGCPMNGDWSLAVRDLWAGDNGFIFSWRIDFNRRLYPAIETFSPQIVQHYWTDNPFITQNNRDSIVAIPRNAGTASFTYRIVDDFTCTHDTAVNIKVLPFTSPNCFSCDPHFNDMRDTAICASSSARLGKTLQDSLNQSITFESFPYKVLSSLTNPLSNPIISSVNVNSIKPLTITDVYTQVDSVCVDLNTRFPADMVFKLKVPGIASTLLLTNSPAISSGRSLRVCFSPNGVAPLGSATPAPPIGTPYTGVYQIQGGRTAWAALNGATVNGDWQLQTADVSGGNLDTLLRWTITLKNQNKVKYTWTPATGLSCTDCPNPVATPTVNTRYIVSTIDSFRCPHKDTVNVAVTRQTAAPLVLTDSMGNGSIVFTWNVIAGATNYEVNVNNTGWVAASRPLTPAHQVSGLRTDDVVNIQVRAVVSPANPCGAAIAVARQVYGVACLFDLRYDSTQTQPITCYGGGTRINLSSYNAAQPTTYSIDGITSGTQNPIFSDIRAGYHRAIGVDNDGCADTLYFFLPQPLPIRDSFRIDSVKCRGTNTGTITTLVSGGTGTMRYNWNLSPRTTPSLDSLRAGTYLVTITDQKNCTKTDTARLYEPDSLLTTMFRDSVRCASGNSGRAWAKTRGGVAPYFYVWDNAPTASIIDTAYQLLSKMYHVTVTDNKNCTKIDSVFIPEPDTLQLRLTTVEATCFGAATGSARVNTIGGSAPFQIRWSNNDVGAVASALRAGRYGVTVTDRQGCMENTDIDITQRPKLNVAIIASKPTCYGMSTGILQAKVTGGTGYSNQLTYTWNGTIFDSMARNMRAGVHQVIVQDLNLCRDTQRITLTQPDSIKFDSLKTTPTACSSTATGTARVVVSGGSGGTYQYAWTYLNAPIGAVSSINNLRSGTYYLTVRDSNSCQRKDSINVGQSQPLIIDSIITTEVRCFGEASGKARAIVHGGTAGVNGYIYRWSDPLSQTLDTAVALRAGNYTLTVTDVNGCSTIRTAMVLEPNALVATGNAVPVNCRNGADGRAYPIVTGGTRISGLGLSYRFAWSHAAAVTDSIAGNLRAGGYQVSVIDAKNCVATASMTVTQPATSVTSTLVQTAKGCHRAFTGEAKATPQGGSPGYNYRWSNGAITQTAPGFAAGWQYVTVTDAKGCSNIDSINIQSLDSIRIYLSSVHPKCFGVDNGRIRIDSVRGGGGNGLAAAYNYQWNTIPVQISSTAAGLGGRSYTVTVTDALNCASTGTAELVTPSKIQLNTEVKNASCFGFANGTATVLATGSINQFTYKWDSAAVGQTTQRALNLKAGNYTVTVTDTAGCTGATTLLITQPSALRINNTRITPNRCVGDLEGGIQLQIIGGTPKYSLKWSNGDSSATISRLRAGTYTISIDDLNGCKLTDSVVLRQPNGITAQVIPKAVKCYGSLDGSITMNASGGTPPYKYSTDDVIYNGINQLVGLKAGDHPIFILDNNNCKWFDRVTVPTPAKLTVDAGQDRTIQLGDSTRLSADIQNARGRVTFTWKAPYDSTLSCKTCPAPMSKPLFTIQYEVTARDSAGCLATDDLKVSVEKPRLVVIPTGFSPNDDNVNDILYVHGREGVKIKVFKIYDRWGEMVFAATDFKPNDPAFGWDGKFHGDPMNTGIFVWYIEVQYLDGATDAFKGNCTLLR